MRGSDMLSVPGRTHLDGLDRAVEVQSTFKATTAVDLMHGISHIPYSSGPWTGRGSSILGIHFSRGAVKSPTATVPTNIVNHHHRRGVVHQKKKKVLLTRRRRTVERAQRGRIFVLAPAGIKAVLLGGS